MAPTWGRRPVRSVVQLPSRVCLLHRGSGALVSDWLGTRLAIAITLATGAIFAVFLLEVWRGTAYEARTMGAMALRLAIWVVISVVAQGKRPVAHDGRQSFHRAPCGLPRYYQQAASRLTGHPVPPRTDPKRRNRSTAPAAGGLPNPYRQFGLVVKLFDVAEAKPGHRNNAFGQAKDIA